MRVVSLDHRVVIAKAFLRFASAGAGMGREGDTNDRAFEELMRSLEASRDAFGSLAGNESLEALALVTRLILEAKQHIEDVQPHRGVIETTTTVFKIIEQDYFSEAVVGDVAMTGAHAFSLRKHYVVYAPLVSQEIEHRLVALGHADYFKHLGLNARVTTSPMQISRQILSVHTQQPVSAFNDGFYWRQALKTIGWLFASIGLYIALRRQPFYDVFVILPIWFRTFYGLQYPNANPDLRNPRLRIVAANAVVAPIDFALLIVAIAIAPLLIAPIGAVAVAIDIGAFLSIYVARTVSESGKWIPKILR